MYALGRGLIHQMTKKDEYNIAILGLDDAGKTVSCHYLYLILYIKYSNDIF